MAGCCEKFALCFVIDHAKLPQELDCIRNMMEMERGHTTGHGKNV